MMIDNATKKCNEANANFVDSTFLKGKHVHTCVYKIQVHDIRLSNNNPYIHRYNNH